MSRATAILRRFLYDARVRDWLAQLAVAGAIFLLLWFFVENASENMVKAGIASGFDFLWRTSGIDVPFRLFEYGPQDRNIDLLYVGIANTVLVSVLAMVFATVLGFAVGVARLSRNWLLSTFAGIYVEFVRNIPLLLFVFFWYFGVVRALPPPRASLDLGGIFFLNNRGLSIPTPEHAGPFGYVLAAFVLGFAAFLALRLWGAGRQAATGRPFPVVPAGLALVVALPGLAALAAGLSTPWNVPVLTGFNFRGGFALIPEFVALLFALVTYTAGFVAEIVRGGILAVSRGQTEAAASLGLRPGQILRLVVIPQAMRVMVPPMTSQYLNVLKNSSFGAAIAFPEIVSVFMGSALNNTGQAIEIIAIVLGIYLAVGLVVSAFMNWYNARIALVTR
ncbi:MAG: ABC transporter permease subunit [Alphaproteobacteria bacterium]|nr:ABC transporter permease subunit [Alphaproteobacteria bacterium]